MDIVIDRMRENRDPGLLNVYYKVYDGETNILSVGIEVPSGLTPAKLRAMLREDAKFRLGQKDVGSISSMVGDKFEV